MGNVEQLKDIQLPDGFNWFIKWLVEEHDFAIDNIVEILEKPWKWQEEWERYHTEVVEPEAKAALEHAKREQAKWGSGPRIYSQEESDKLWEVSDGE
jgi:hypothetical protein